MGGINYKEEVEKFLADNAKQAANNQKTQSVKEAKETEEVLTFGEPATILTDELKAAEKALAPGTKGGDILHYGFLDSYTAQQQREPKRKRYSITSDSTATRTENGDSKASDTVSGIAGVRMG